MKGETDIWKPKEDLNCHTVSLPRMYLHGPFTHKSLTRKVFPLILQHRLEPCHKRATFINFYISAE
jgi:hypothetical protein